MGDPKANETQMRQAFYKESVYISKEAIAKFKNYFRIFTLKDGSTISRMEIVTKDEANRQIEINDRDPKDFYESIKKIGSEAFEPMPVDDHNMPK